MVKRLALTTILPCAFFAAMLAVDWDTTFHSPFGAIIGRGDTLTLMPGAIVTGIPFTPEIRSGSLVLGFAGLVAAVGSRKIVIARRRSRKEFEA